MFTNDNNNDNNRYHGLRVSVTLPLVSFVSGNNKNNNNDSTNHNNSQS